MSYTFVEKLSIKLYRLAQRCVCMFVFDVAKKEKRSKYSKNIGEVSVSTN